MKEVSSGGLEGAAVKIKLLKRDEKEMCERGKETPANAENVKRRKNRRETGKFEKKRGAEKRNKSLIKRIDIFKFFF